MLALVAHDIEWIIPGQHWPLAGTHRGHAAVAALFRKASSEVALAYPSPPEYIAQGDRVIVIGFAQGQIRATNRPFEDHFVFAVTVRHGRMTHIREYVDTQALALAAQSEGPGRP